MEFVNIAFVMRNIRKIIFSIIRGAAISLLGTAITVVMANSFLLFASVRSESGYSAVFDFILASAIFSGSVGLMYFIGSTRKKGKKNAK